MPCRLLAFACFAAFIFAVRGADAHTVGLSRAEYVVEGRTVVASVTLAGAELGANADRERLGAEVVMGTRVDGDGQPCAGSLDSVTVDQQDGLVVRSRYRCPATPSSLHLHVGLFDQLPPGHREIARIDIGGTTTETILYRGHEDLAAGQAQPTSPASSVTSFVRMGVEHIVTGYDHVLFLFGLVLVGGSIRSLVGAVTAFTVAHSITLALAVVGVWAPPARVVEPTIAASIVWVGVENFFLESASGRWRITFPFGLVHGFGFASALRQVEVQPGALAAALVSFNVGVELGQLAIMAAMVPTLLQLRLRGALDRRVTRVVSAAVACAGAVLFVVRLSAHPS